MISTDPAFGQTTPLIPAQPGWCREGLCGLDVCSLLALGASGDVKRYALAFLEGLKAAGVDCRVMREEVLATVFRGDEAKAFCVVKPFHCSACHFDAPD